MFEAISLIVLSLSFDADCSLDTFDQVQQKIEAKKISINIRDSKGRSLLMHKFLAEQKIWLIDQGINLEFKDKNGFGAIHHAADQNQGDVIKKLVLAKADLTAVTGRTRLKKNRFVKELFWLAGHRNVLHILAATYNPTKTISFILEASPDLLIGLDDFHRTPLHIAAAHGNWPSLELMVNALKKLFPKEEEFLAHLDTVDTHGFTALGSAVRGGHWYEAQILLNAKANPRAKIGHTWIAIEDQTSLFGYGDLTVQKAFQRGAKTIADFVLNLARETNHLENGDFNKETTSRLQRIFLNI
jgi:ankyrin repeat protein